MSYAASALAGAIGDDEQARCGMAAFIRLLEADPAISKTLPRVCARVRARLDIGFHSRANLIFSANNHIIFAITQCALHAPQQTFLSRLVASLHADGSLAERFAPVLAHARARLSHPTHHAGHANADINSIVDPPPALNLATAVRPLRALNALAAHLPLATMLVEAPDFLEPHPNSSSHSNSHSNSNKSAREFEFRTLLGPVHALTTERADALSTAVARVLQRGNQHRDEGESGNVSVRLSTESESSTLSNSLTCCRLCRNV